MKKHFRIALAFLILSTMLCCFSACDENGLISYIASKNDEVANKPEYEEVYHSDTKVDWDGDYKEGSVRVTIEMNDDGTLNVNIQEGAATESFTTQGSGEYYKQFTFYLYKDMSSFNISSYTNVYTITKTGENLSYTCTVMSGKHSSSNPDGEITSTVTTTLKKV